METPNGSKLALLRRARRAADSVRRITSTLIMTGETADADTDIDDFCSLMEKRQPLVAEIVRLKTQADALPEDGAACAEEARALKETLAAIAQLDREHRETAKQVMASLKNSIRGVKAGRKLSDAYGGMLTAGQPGRLDAQQ